ncbi:telomeric repeat-binding factor 1-like [Brachionichthys hirsutus]|uniref:telomeric repeat-binding factor 1-like n=1 Tax=Brachionichthys hirsutus TaxID=412623 RepID=UPI003604C9D8
MERKSCAKISTNVNNSDEGVSFSSVSNVVSGWTFDFMFLSLCRCFKEDKLDEFNEKIEAICLSPSLKRKLQNEKTLICAFLSRIMHGKQFDVQFDDDDDCVSPLVSAAKIWSKLECTVADKSLFKDISILLIIQSVAVCLEKGQRSSASSALKWFKNNYELSQNLGVKLSNIVAETETYHPLLMSFSFSRLREAVQTYLDSYLEENPSDYLLKEATTMLQSSRGVESVGDLETRDGSLSEAARTPTQAAE